MSIFGQALPSSLVRILVLAGFLAALFPTPSAAQIGALKKKAGKAVTEAVTGEEAAPAAGGATAAGGAFHNEFVVPIDDAMLDRLSTGLEAEEAERVEVAAVLATFPSPEARGQCQMQVAQGEEIQGLLAEYVTAMEKAGSDQQAMMRAAEAMDTTMRAVYDRECGVELDSERERELQQRPGLAGAEAAGLTELQYSILKERIPPLCGAGGGLQRGEGRVSVPVAGTSVAYVFTETEVEALTPRCDTFTSALAAAG